jgi:hypothetical protein
MLHFEDKPPRPPPKPVRTKVQIFVAFLQGLRFGGRCWEKVPKA